MDNRSLLAPIALVSCVACSGDSAATTERPAVARRAARAAPARAQGSCGAGSASSVRAVLAACSGGRSAADELASSTGGTGNAGGGGTASGGRNDGSGGAASCGASNGGNDGSGGTAAGSRIRHVFVVAMENHDDVQIIGDSTDAPYINGTLVKDYAIGSNFVDTVALGVPSEPHYVLMEAGTNVFSDVTFTNDDDPSATNSTTSTEHLVTQMKNATPSVSWTSYQEGLNDTTGACPTHSSGFYAAKHDPFVFFQDVSGAPPSKTEAYCAAHHASTDALADDLKNDRVAAYSFITPNQCNDMHGQSGCPQSNTIRAGDDWLAANLPPIIDYATSHDGVIFIVWDEGSATLRVPFLAIGPRVKKGYASPTRFTHGSLTRTVERIFGLPYLSTVAGENDFGDVFEDGAFP